MNPTLLLHIDWCTGKSFLEARNICRLLCTKIVLKVKKTKQRQQFVYTTCSADILSLQFSWKMNNLLSIWHRKLVRWCKNNSFWQRFTCIIEIPICDSILSFCPNTKCIACNQPCEKFVITLTWLITNILRVLVHSQVHILRGKRYVLREGE